MKTLNKRIIASAACAIIGVMGVTDAAQAAFTSQATSANIGIDLPVTAPVCSVWTGTAASSSTTTSGVISTVSPAITLPSVSSPSTTVGQYFGLNGISTLAYNLTSNWYTSAALNQTATIQCDTANTIISSFVVQPDSSKAALVPSTTNTQYLIPAPGSTTYAAGGVLQMIFEQYAVNGTTAQYSYWGGSGNSSQAYSTGFSTGALSSGKSYATVVWRPVMSNNSSTNSAVIGSPPTGTAWYAYAQLSIGF